MEICLCCVVFCCCSILFCSIGLDYIASYCFVFTSREGEKQKEIAGLEAQVYRFAEILGEQRAATRENVIRKQARTGEEREESDEEDVAADSDEDDDDVPYNPKNLPLGWDGKVNFKKEESQIYHLFTCKLFELCQMSIEFDIKI